MREGWTRREGGWEGGRERERDIHVDDIESSHLTIIENHGSLTCKKYYTFPHTNLLMCFRRSMFQLLYITPLHLRIMS